MVQNSNETTLTPAVDIHETEEGMVLTADLPRVSKDNLEISVEHNVLTLHGRVDNVEPAGSPIHREIRRGDYFRSFILSDDLDTEQIAAKLDAGVLTLRIPKSARLRPRKIAVEAS